MPLRITCCFFSEYMLLRLRLYCACDSKELERIRTRRYRITYTFYSGYILLALRIYSLGSEQTAAAKFMVPYTTTLYIPIKDTKL